MYIPNIFLNMKIKQKQQTLWKKPYIFNSYLEIF